MRRIVVVTLLGLVAGLWACLLDASVQGGPGRTYAQPPEPTATVVRQKSLCSSTWSNGASPREINHCGSSDVTVRFRPYCPVCPGGVHVVYVMPMLAPLNDWMKDSAVRSLDQFKDTPGLSAWIGVVLYSKSQVQEGVPMTQDLAAVEGGMQSPGRGTDNAGDFEGAARLAESMLRDAQKDHGVAGANPCEYIVFFTYTDYSNNALVSAQRRAAQAMSSQRTLMVGCPAVKGYRPATPTNPPGPTPTPRPGGIGRIGHCANEPNLPKPSQYYAEPSNVSQLGGFFKIEISKMLGDTGGLLDMSLVQRIPAGLTYKSASTPPASVGPAGDGTGDTLVKWTWPRDAIKLLDVYGVTYRVAPDLEGDYDLSGLLEINDSHSKTSAPEMPLVSIHVNDDPCGPTPTPKPVTDTPEPATDVPPTDTPMPTPTHTPTSTVTPSPTPTVTPTPTPRSAYLPVVIRESCKEFWVYSDVTLVLDLSNSMSEPLNGSQTKLEASQAAARTFIAQMDFTPDEQGQHDQVAVVGFNQTAWIQQGLTRDAAAIEKALVDLGNNQASNTRLDLAFERASEVLRSDARHPNNTSVILLLTDGQPSGVPLADDGTMETTVRIAAARAKVSGHRIFTIAIGRPEETNPALLKECASEPTDYYYAPDAAELAKIYTEIAFSFGCPKWRFWGKR